MRSSRQRKFAFDDFLRKEYRWDIASDAPLCSSYGVTACTKGRFCRKRHEPSPYVYKIVCRHWLKGLCKLGDYCEYLHELNMSRLTECPVFAKTGKCPLIPECPFKHTEVEKGEQCCSNYERGFCKLGPKCPKPHIRQEMCLRYLTGFCPLGLECENAHPKFVQIDDSMRISRDKQDEKPAFMLEAERNAA
ncbi:cleavage polyadenylation factor RNA-binding subunit [Starmerella bacillaris]|uniref:mRNA 3'-end-processing protein n=1 Tax=Starmerella bacillaris TaxID=1247836 RepID=A0AAV5RN54_STABA|nr:cleavage polyadenylation factor RNA-binding subunit [Starmerella bacillaris]